MTNGGFRSFEVMDASDDIDRTDAVNYGRIHRVTTLPSSFPGNVLDCASTTRGAPSRFRSQPKALSRQAKASTQEAFFLPLHEPKSILAGILLPAARLTDQDPER